MAKRRRLKREKLLLINGLVLVDKVEEKKNTTLI